LSTATDLFKCLDDSPPLDDSAVRPKSKITVRGQSATMENRAILVKANGAELREILSGKACPVGYPTLIQALDAAPSQADTLIVDYLPDLLEHMELITRIGDVKFKRIIFRQASRTHGYFLS